MRKIRNFAIVGGALLMFFALAATGVKAQALTSTQFTGSFTLPFMAQWGNVTLPSGDYDLYYGSMNFSGANMVEIRGQGEAPHAMFIAAGRNDTKATENALVCVMEGGKAYVRSLELPAIGEGASFTRPKGVRVESWIVSEMQNNNANTELVATRASVVRVPVKVK